MRKHKVSYRVYYEDTDAGGVVYYANYLKFAERARTEMLREMGVNQSELSDKKGVFFVVRHVEADLQKSAKLDDMLEIETTVSRISSASLLMEQHIKNIEGQVAVVKVKIACVKTSKNKFAPTKIPEEIKKKFAA